jgi:HSP20 family protein
MANLVPFWSLTPAAHSGIERLFDELWGAAQPARATARAAEFTPRMDVEETPEAIRVTAELPGLEDKDFEVLLEGDVLAIKGERRDEQKEERKGFYHLERRSGSFRRALRLPFEPAPESLRATYKSGVLTIEVPKPEEKSKQRTIPVTTA